MTSDWDQEDARAVAAAKSPGLFIKQQVAPLLHNTTSLAVGKTDHQFGDEREFWAKAKSTTFASVKLDNFRLSDWFPRTPGVYWSRHGKSARKSTWSGPTINDPELGHIFTPRAKMALIEEGGIGTIRLRPRRIDSTDCWLATAVKGRQCAGGIPLALPHSFLAEGKVAWGDTAIVRGRVRFLQDAGLDDVAAYVHHSSPVIIFVESIESSPDSFRSATPIILTPVALFDQTSRGPDVFDHLQRDLGSNFGYTFVHSEADSNGELLSAASWIERYAAKHGGQVITNFDELSPILSNAPLSYQRLITKTYDRVVIENLNLERLAERIDLAATSEYNNYGQVGAMGDHARSDNNSLLGTFVQGAKSLFGLVTGTQGGAKNTTKSESGTKRR